jgi:hypothetical protein
MNHVAHKGPGGGAPVDDEINARYRHLRDIEKRKIRDSITKAREIWAKMAGHDSTSAEYHRLRREHEALKVAREAAEDEISALMEQEWHELNAAWLMEEQRRARNNIGGVGKPDMLGCGPNQAAAAEKAKADTEKATSNVPPSNIPRDRRPKSDAEARQMARDRTRRNVESGKTAVGPEVTAIDAEDAAQDAWRKTEEGKASRARQDAEAWDRKNSKLKEFDDRLDTKILRKLGDMGKVAIAGALGPVVGKEKARTIANSIEHLTNKGKLDEKGQALLDRLFTEEGQEDAIMGAIDVGTRYATDLKNVQEQNANKQFREKHSAYLDRANEVLDRSQGMAPGSATSQPSQTNQQLPDRRPSQAPRVIEDQPAVAQPQQQYSRETSNMINEINGLLGEGLPQSVEKMGRLHPASHRARLYANILTRGDTYTERAAAWIMRHRHEVVESLAVVRTPLQANTEQALSFVTLGQWEEAKRDVAYDSLFHLALIVNGKYTIEKDPNPSFSDRVKATSSSEFMKVGNPPTTTTIMDLLNRTQRKMGNRDYFTYSAFHNNCQTFVMSILSANDVLTPEIRDFVYQPVDELLKRLPGYTEPVATAVANLVGIKRDVTADTPESTDAMDEEQIDGVDMGNEDGDKPT